MEQTQNGISDERLAELRNSRRRIGICVKTVREIASELLETRRELATLRKALSDPTTVHVNILRGTIALTKGQAIHIAGLPADIEEELTALRASHKRMVDVLEEIERHHLELNRAKGRPANHSHTLRLCAAALAEARKLEGK